jgi:hypothetical protein
MKPLRYFFLRCYELAVSQRSPTPWLRPLVLLSVLSGLNALVVIWVCVELWGGGMPIGQRESATKVAIAAWTILVFVTFYFRWIKGGRYLAFKEEFRDESAARRRLRTALMLTYASVSLCGPAVVGYWVSVR